MGQNRVVPVGGVMPSAPIGIVPVGGAMSSAPIAVREPDFKMIVHANDAPENNDLPWYSDPTSGAYKKLVDAYVTGGPGRVHEGIQDLFGRKNDKGETRRWGGVHDIVQGSMVTAAPMLAPAAIGAVVAAPGVALLGAGSAIAAGSAGGAVLSGTAKAIGASEDQANVAGDVGLLGGGYLGAKYGPAGFKAATDALASRKATATEGRINFNFKKIAPASKTADYTPGQRDRVKVYLANEHQQSPIESVESLRDAADASIGKMEQAVRDAANQFKGIVVRMNPLAKIRAAFSNATRSDDLSRALSEIETMRLDQPMDAPRAAELLHRLNAENKAVLTDTKYDIGTARTVSPAFRARELAADEIRSQLYDFLEAKGIPGVRDFRLDEGAMIAVRNAVNRQIYAGDKAVTGTGTNSLPRKIIARLATATGAASGASIGGVPGAAAGAELGQEIGQMIAPGNRLRDDLVKQLFNDLGTPPPVPGLTFNAPGFVAPNTGALGAGRGPSGGVPPPSGAGPSSGGSVTSQRPAPWKRSGLPPAPPIEGELVGSRPVGGSPAPVPVGPSPVKGALPPPSMIPLAASSTWPDVERPQIVRLGSGEAVPVGDKPNRMAPVGVVPAQNAEPAAGTPEFKVGFGKDLKLFRTAKPGSPDQTAALDRIITKIQQSPKPPSVTSFDPYKGTEVEGYDVFPPKGGVPKNFWPEFYAEHKLRLTPEVKAQLQHIHEGLENFQFEQGYHQTEYDPTGTFQTGEIEGFRTPWTPYKRMIEEFAPAAPARREPRGMDFAKTTEVAGQKSLQAVNQLLANGRVDNNLKLGALRLAESLVKEGGFDAMLQPLNRAAVKPAYGADNFSPEMFEDK